MLRVYLKHKEQTGRVRLCVCVCACADEMQGRNWRRLCALLNPGAALAAKIPGMLSQEHRPLASVIRSFIPTQPTAPRGIQNSERDIANLYLCLNMSQPSLLGYEGAALSSQEGGSPWQPLEFGSPSIFVFFNPCQLAAEQQKEASEPV